MADGLDRNLRFGPFRAFERREILRRDGLALPLGGRALDVLIYLVERPGEVATKKELIDHAWPDVVVEEGNLRVHISAIRKALGDGKFGNRYIANIQGRGYSFVGSVADLTTVRHMVQTVSTSHAATRPAGWSGATRFLAMCRTAFVGSGSSLLGPGGIGKTTIAVAVGHALAEEFGEKSISSIWEALPIRITS